MLSSFEILVAKVTVVSTSQICSSYEGGGITYFFVLFVFFVFCFFQKFTCTITKKTKKTKNSF